jgi:transposase
VSAFAFFGGVPCSIMYDNTTIAVAKTCGDRKRERTRAFTELVSHYLFQDRFGRPGKDNDKGKVEGLVKFSRANFIVPIPQAASFDALNAYLEESLPGPPGRACQASRRDHWQAVDRRYSGVA